MMVEQKLFILAHYFQQLTFAQRWCFPMSRRVTPSSTCFPAAPTVEVQQVTSANNRRTTAISEAGSSNADAESRLEIIVHGASALIELGIA